MKYDVNDDFDFQMAAYKTNNISNTNSYTLLQARDYTFSGMELNDQTIGDTIYVLIDGLNGTETENGFGISVKALTPVNDDSCNEILIRANGEIVKGFTNVAATIQENEEFLIPASKDPSTGWFDQDIRHSVWFKFAAPPTGEAIIDVLNATFDSQIIVLEQSRTCDPVFFSQWTHVGANDALTLAGGLDSRVTLKGLLPGQPYGFIVDGFEGETGNFDVRISSPIPFNDEPETAIELVIDAAGQGVFTNDGSTSSDEEQVISPPTVPLNKPGGWSDVEGDSRARRIEHSVWFKFKAPAEGAVKISTCDQENFFLQMALYKIGDLKDYSTYELLGSDSESQFCRRPPSNESPNGRNIRGAIMNITDLIPDETYYLIIDGGINSVGQFSIDLLTTPITDPPVNDEPCDAIELPVNGEVQTGYKNFAATSDKSNTGYDITPSEWLDDDMGGTVWFTFTGPSSGEVEISTCDMANFDTQLAVFTLNGCEIDSLAVLMGANEDGPSNCATGGDSYLTIKNLTEGKKYYLVVDGYGANKGNFSIVLKDQITPGPANDEVANAIELPVDGEVKSGFTNVYATVEDGEQNIRPVPVEDQDCSTGWCDNQIDNSVWYKFVAPEDGKVNISTCDLADFDTQLALFSVSDVSDFSTFSLEAANDAGPEDCSTFFDSYLPVTGLTAGETYYILVDGFDGDNGAFSISLTGVADVIAPTAPTEPTTGTTTETTAEISWTAATDNVAVVQYEVFVDDSSIGKTENTSFTISELTGSQTYAVTIVAIDSAGNKSDASTSLSVTTEAAPDSEAPSTPTGLAATEIRTTGIDISWDAATDNVEVKEYKVYVDGVLTATVTGTTFSISGLTDGEAYSIYIVAVDNAGNTSKSSKALKVTAGATVVIDTEAPSAPSGLAATEVTDSEITLSWEAAADNVGVKEYKVYVDGVLSATVSDTTFSITGLTAGEAYSIYLVAVDNAGNTSEVSTPLKVTTAKTAEVDTEAPSTPSGLAANDVTDSGITLTWEAATDNVEVKEYKVYVDGVLAATVTSTTFSITGLTAGEAYSIYVVAVDNAGNTSEVSTALKVTTATAAVADTEAPSVPSGLATNEVTDVGIKFSWDAASDNVGVTTYEIFVDGASNGTTSETTYTITDLTKLTAYSVQVSASDAAGNTSAISAALKVTTVEEGTSAALEFDINDLYQVYPNPFSNKVSLRSLGGELENGSVEVVNLLGKVVLTPELIRESMGLIRMDLNTLPEGVHFLIIKTKNGKVFKRLLKR
jgi:chitodextrinase